MPIGKDTARQSKIITTDGIITASIFTVVEGAGEDIDDGEYIIEVCVGSTGDGLGWHDATVHLKEVTVFVKIVEDGSKRFKGMSRRAKKLGFGLLVTAKTTK